MSQIYLVVALRGDEVNLCEAFFAASLALGRAFQAATNLAQYAVSTNPGEETMPDGSTCWTFLNNGKATVKVYLREVGDSLPSQRDPMSFLGGLSNTMDVPKDMAPSKDPLPSIAVQPSAWVQPIAQSPIHQQPTTPSYYFTDSALPVGWFQNGKPALMGDMLDHPFDVKDPLWDLTEDQKWALVEVRVRKSPGFLGRSLLAGICRPDHTTALQELRWRTDHGKQIRDEEIEALHAMREDLMAGVQNS